MSAAAQIAVPSLESRLAALEHEVRVAQAASEVAGTPDARLLAFEIDALLSAANVDRNFHDDVRSLADARRIIGLRLGVTPPRRRSRPATRT